MGAVVGPVDLLAVLDFSGTLSLGAVRFGRDESLRRELEASGLRALGVDGPATFWERIINPTWELASTTRHGYVRCLAREVRRLAAAAGRRVPAGEARAAAERFARAYLARSTIDPAWGEVLRDLAGRPEVKLVVATDHYAEATAHIVGELQALGVEAAPALAAGRGHVAVANSADLGAHKASPAFWRALQRAWGPARPTRVALVDDFGRHEQLRDAYRGEELARARQRQVVELVATTFCAEVAVFPFILRCGAEAGEYQALIAAAASFLRAAAAGRGACLRRGTP